MSVHLRNLMLATAALLAAMPAWATSPNGYGSILTLPVVVQSSTYQSAIFIHNPNAAAIDIAVTYYGATGSATPNVVACPNINVPANQTFTSSLTAMCALFAGSNFGRIRLYELEATNQPFTAYSRVETFSGNGFSIEAFKPGEFANNGASPSGRSNVLGLRRQAAAPGYQSNCFVAALGEAVDVSYGLIGGNGVQLGAQQIVSLTANQMVRILDVFSTVGAPAGDHSNVRAYFYENGADEPGFVAFCTVQNNASFDADFRIAKNQDPQDERMRFTATGIDGITKSSALALTAFEDDIFQVFWQHPDWVRCFIGATTPSNLEMRIKDPDGTVVAGGGDVTDTGEFYLGDRNAVNGGVNGIWRIEVGSALGGTTDAYTLTCTAGNGSSRPLRVGRQNDAF